MSKALGIDFGTVYVGLALSDAERLLARPHGILKNFVDVIPQIVALVGAEGVDTIVVGKPLTLRGTSGPILREAEFFFDKLKRALPEMRIVWEDERLSTHQVVLQRIRAGWSKKKRRERRDAQAAANILQVFLDRDRK